MPSRRIVQIVLIVALGCAPSCKRTRDYGRDRADIEQVFNKYLQTLTTLDTSQAAQVWLRSPDVLVVTPVGRLTGWDSVQKNIYVDSATKDFTERNVQATNVSIIVAGNAAWLVYDFVYTAKLANGQPLVTKGWESHGYQRTAEGWRIAFLHYSFSPPAA